MMTNKYAGDILKKIKHSLCKAVINKMCAEKIIREYFMDKYPGGEYEG